MNRTFLKHEFLITARSMKNIPFVVFIGLLMLSYCLLIVPNEKTKESFDVDETVSYLTNLEGEQQFRLNKGHTGIVMFTGMPVFAQNAYYYGLYHALLMSYEDKNFTRFLHLRANYLEENANEYIFDDQLFKKSPIPGKDREHLYHQTMIRYENYLTKEHPISYGLMMEKTGLQALKNFLLEYGIYFFVFCAIYFSSDILTRDRKNRSVLQGMPLSWYRQLNLKTFSSFLYVHLVIIGIIVIGVALITFQFGFGYFNLDVPIMIAQQTFTRADYDVISLAAFLGKVAIVLPILVFIFIRLNIILSLLVRSEWFALVVSSFILFSERIYFTRTSRELFGIDIGFLPQTYFDFGKVVTGEKNFLMNMETITVAKGIVVLLITLAVIETIVYIISHVVNKRRFYQVG